MIRRKKRDMGGIPTASLSDVAFLLLIFFLSTTKFDIKKGLGIVLPPASQKADKRVKLKDENITKVLINREGNVKIQGKDIDQEVSMAELEKTIKDLVKNNPDMVISLKADRRSKYQYMVMALDRLQAAGAEKISLSTN